MEVCQCSLAQVQRASEVFSQTLTGIKGFSCGIQRKPSSDPTTGCTVGTAALHVWDFEGECSCVRAWKTERAGGCVSGGACVCVCA